MNPAPRRPAVQYLRTGLRQELYLALERLPSWQGVRIAGHDPREIRTVEGLLVWLDGYVKVVESLRDQLVTERASRMAIQRRYDKLARRARARGLDDLVDDEPAAETEGELVWCALPGHPPTPHTLTAECAGPLAAR